MASNRPIEQPLPFETTHMKEELVPYEPSLLPPPLTVGPKRRRRRSRSRRRHPHNHNPQKDTTTTTDLLNHNDDKEHKGDLSRTLEHLMAVGWKEQREAQRYQAFGGTHPFPGPAGEPLPQRHPTGRPSDHDNDLLYNDDEEVETTRSRGSNKVSALKKAFVEDIRLYGETYTAKYDGLERSPWPGSKRLQSAPAATTRGALSRNPNCSRMDEHWELEYGDSIHPLAFSSARLSQQNTTRLSSEELAAINGPNLNVTTTVTSLPEHDVPRALLLRCWQRAVDAASQTTSVTVGLDAAAMEGTEYTRNRLHHTGPYNIPQPRAVKEVPFTAAQQVMAQDRFGMKRKCTSMGLGLTRAQLPMDVSKGMCPSCYRQFEQPHELQQHYYGGGRDDLRGCCWQRIVQKEPRVVADVLENHVKSQINQYLGLIMDRAHTKVAEKGNVDSTSAKAPFTWYDVLQFTEEALNSSHSVETSAADPRNGIHPIFETLQRKSDSDLLVLNPTVLHNARKRLVDRYANVPR